MVNGDITPTIRGASDDLLMQWLEAANRAALVGMLRGEPAERANDLADALHAEAVRRGLLEVAS